MGEKEGMQQNRQGASTKGTNRRHTDTQEEAYQLAEGEIELELLSFPGLKVPEIHSSHQIRGTVLSGPDVSWDTILGWRR
eukprot:2693920-Rhodomonas_salina.1